ncbi:hypothetical protein P7K49_035580 [Saguinus oedipus]|uniref:Uncharacterized protein n=1 Tax=Saguinus oedipus TaxID=9490 RepID=A0ABQ9TNP4_SAGOE|nr:hypothetical protein P7K49_035580 [Saguinus oedipus]
MKAQKRKRGRAVLPEPRLASCAAHSSALPSRACCRDAEATGSLETPGPGPGRHAALIRAGLESVPLAALARVVAGLAPGNAGNAATPSFARTETLRAFTVRPSTAAGEPRPPPRRFARSPTAPSRGAGQVPLSNPCFHPATPTSPGRA